MNGSVLQDGAPVAVAYRLIRHDGQDTPGTFLGVSTEKLFRGWVEGLTSPVGGWDNYLPIPLDAEWTVG